MTQIQINLTDDEDKIVNNIKAIKNLKTKTEAVKYIISLFKIKGIGIIEYKGENV